jgi:hypothetical protein
LFTYPPDEMMTHSPLNTHTITTANLVSSSLGAGTYGMSFGVSSSLSFTVAGTKIHFI